MLVQNINKRFWQEETKEVLDFGWAMKSENPQWDSYTEVCLYEGESGHFICGSTQNIKITKEEAIELINLGLTKEGYERAQAILGDYCQVVNFVA